MMLIHRCTICGHANHEHRYESCQYGYCPKKRHLPVLDAAPELIPTFDVKGSVVERVVRPGEAINKGNEQSQITTCKCEACIAEYERVAS